MAQQQFSGVRGDSDARPAREPVTVVVTPKGREMNCDTWSDANNRLATGCTIKAGCPTGPAQATGDEAPRQPQSPNRSGGSGSIAPVETAQNP